MAATTTTRPGIAVQCLLRSAPPESSGRVRRPFLILPSQIIPCDVECIRNMLHDLAHPPAVLNQHNVEATGTIPDPMLRKVLSRQLNQLGTFARINRLDGAAEGPGPPPLHFDEHQHPLIIGDQIQFTQRRAHIPAKNSKSLPTKVCLGSALPLVSYRTASVAHRVAAGRQAWSADKRNAAWLLSTSWWTGAKLQR